MDHHPGYRKHQASGRGSGNSRNGKSRKLVQGEFGQTEIETPRDRKSSFEPKLIGKHQRRFPGFDQKVIALFAKGMTTRDIADTMHELNEVEVSHDLISQVTESVQSEVVAWQSRPMEEVYPILFMDGLVVSIRAEGKIVKHTIYLALCHQSRRKERTFGVMDLKNEGAKFWLSVMTDLKTVESKTFSSLASMV